MAGSGTGLVRHDLATGAKTPMQLGGAGGKLCGMSGTVTADGVGIAAWSQDGRSCQTAGAVDLASGQVRWTATFAGFGKYTQADKPATVGSAVPIAIAGNVVLIGVEDVVSSFGLTDGTPGWRWISERTEKSNSYVDSIVADKDTVLFGLTDVGTERAYAISVDPATGKDRWTTEFPAGTSRDAYPLATNPVAFVNRHVEDDGYRYGDIVTLDAAGKVQATIKEEGSWGILDLQYRKWSGGTSLVEWPVVVDRGTVYASSARGKYGSDRQVVAFDLVTGTPKWAVPLGSPKANHLALLGVDADGVYVASGENAGDGNPLAVRKFAAANGKPTPAGTLAQAPAGLLGDNVLAQRTGSGYLFLGVSAADEYRVALLDWAA